MQMTNLIHLNWFDKWHQESFLLLRLLIGSFLIWGVWDNIIDEARMAEFVSFLKQFGFIKPNLMAQLSVWAQFLIGLSFVFGLFTRLFSIVCIFNFVVAIIMVDSVSGIRASFPSAMLIAVSLYMLCVGAGKYSLDRVFLKQ